MPNQYLYVVNKQSVVNINTKPLSWAEYWKNRYSWEMSAFNMHPSTRLLAHLFILLGLCACERETYTTWKCHNSTENKISMVLRKAKMEFKGDQFDYCGSLGNQSYFDKKCPALTKESATKFTPSSGLLLSRGQEYQCVAL